MESQLRDLLDAAVGDPPRPVSIAAVRRRVVRRRAAKWVAAATAVVLLTGLGAVVSALAAGPEPPAADAGSLIGVPRYYVVQEISGKLPGIVVVRATATGTVTATVHSPWAGASIAIGEITPAGHQAFFIVCQKTGPGPGAAVTGSRLYRFRVTRSGRVSGYALVRGGVLNGLSAGRMAVTPDGSEIAVAVSPGADTKPAPGNILVINTRTGTHAVWHSGADVPGTVRYGAGDLSLTSNGQELAFLTVPQCVPGGTTACAAGGGQQVRAVSPAAGGGQLSSSRLLMRWSGLHGLSRGYVNFAMITPDGSAVTVVTAHSGQTQTTSAVQVSAATGQQLRVLYRVNTGNGFSYRFTSSDPSGRYLLLDVGTVKDMVNGWIDHGRLIRLKPAGNNIFFEAW